MSTPPAPPSLTARTVRGVAWTLPTSLLSRVIGLVGTLVLARFLVPEEYGQVMAAAILTVTAFSVTTFGVGIYLVSNREVTRAEAFHATCWFLATGVVALGGVWALSGPIGRWSDATGLGRYMPMFILSAFLDRIAFLPERMLIRKIKFRWLSLSRAAGEVTFTVVSVVMAAEGFGAMSIAWGYLARAVLRAATIVPAVNWREWLEPHRLRAGVMIKIIRAGMNVSVASVATFLMRRWDNMLVSRYFGPATMGAYNYAYNLADTPAVAIGEQMSDVVAASFPHAEGSKRSAALVRACTMISLIMFPLAFGLGAVAETVVETFFDEQWAAVGTMLVFLSILSAPRPLAHVVHSYLFTCGRTAVILWMEWASLAALILAISTIGRIGINWTCGAVGIVFVLRTLALLWAVKRLDGIPIRRFLLPLLRPTVACVAMVVAIALARPALGGLTPAARLIVEIAIGAAVYLAGGVLIFRSAAGEFLRLVQTAVSGR